MTYSIIARGRDGEFGAAVQSKFSGVGTITLHARAGVGVLTTQAFADPDHGRRGLGLLELGTPAAVAVDTLLLHDTQREQRQISLLGDTGRPASFTGAEVRAWDGHAGSHEGAHCLAAGNALTGDRVLAAMVEAFENSGGEFAEQLITALRAGRDAGGELRGQQSAAVLVVKPGGGYAGSDGRLVDISIYDHASPIEELARCYALHRLAYFPSREEDLLEIDPALADELKTLLRSQGYAQVSEGHDWSEQDIATLRRFMGMENYDNRLRDDALIDAEVLADLRRRHGYPEG